MKNFLSLKGRTINYDKPVKVYRNLNRKGILYSISQDGLVVGYSDEIMLSNAKFVVNMKAKEKIIETKNRTVITDTNIHSK
jgi:DNA-binding transcriptional regulator YhcF (GntR family)